MDNPNVVSNPEQPQGGQGLAVASMVLGILAILFLCCVPYVSFVLAIVSIILGGVAISKKTAGKGMAIAGIVCSVIAIVLGIVVIVVGFGALSYLESMSV